MRKKLQRFLSVVCSFFAISALATACDLSLPNESGGGGEKERAERVVIADYESWETGIQLIRTNRAFGKISWNKDAQYVKDGIGSAKLQPMGSYHNGSTPAFFYETSSELFDFDYRDFSDAKSITADFYNTEETELKVAIGIVTTMLGVESYQFAPYEYQVLPAKQWTEITYKIDTSILSISNDVKDIKGVYIAFENMNTRYLEGAPTVYMDNLILHRYDYTPEIKDLVQLEQNEYINFESPSWQSYVVGQRGGGNDPTISIVKKDEAYTDSTNTNKLVDAEQSDEYISGEYVLQAIAPQYTVKNAWPGVRFAAALFEKSLFGKLDKQDYGQVTFKFDVYNPRSTLLPMGVSFHNASDYRSHQYGFGANPGWTTFECSLKDLYEKYVSRYGDPDFFSAPGCLTVEWRSDYITEETILYFDNFRFEIAEKDPQAKATITMSPFVRSLTVGETLVPPSVMASDEYDIELQVAVKAYYKNGEAWEEIAQKQGKFPIDSVGEYKLVASCTNSVGNTTTVEYPFKGVAKAEKKNVFADYEYADEASSIKIGDKTTTKYESSKSAEHYVEFLEEVNIGGQRHENVMKIVTSNHSDWGVGIVGFSFADEYMRQARNAKWTSMTFRIYIETQINVPSVLLFSSQTLLTSEKGLKTKEWVDFVVSKNVLNGERPSQVTSGISNDKTFYDGFADLCSIDNLSHFFYISTAAMDNLHMGSRAQLEQYPQVTYYIEQITWTANSGTGVFDGENFVEDVYDDEWADPFKKKFDGENFVEDDYDDEWADPFKKKAD